MKENADTDQSKMSFRNPDWILILGMELYREWEFLNVLPAGSAPPPPPKDSRVPLETTDLFLFTVIAVLLLNNNE